MYMEDLDLCYRFARGRLADLVRAVGDGDPRQGRDAAGSTAPASSTTPSTTGMYRFYRKHYSSSHNPLFNGLIYVGIGAKLAISATRSALARSLARFKR